MKEKGFLIVISGFSGAGKGTVVKKLCENHPYKLSVSATTREPREGETHGSEYFFKTAEEFEQLIEENGFIEWAKYIGNYYGTPKADIEKQLELGNDIILEIEIQGAMNVKKMFPDALLLFITPTNVEELKIRLMERCTETEKDIEDRMNRAYEESPYMNHYDYIIINDELDQCVDMLHSIIKAHHFSKKHSQTIIKKMQRELEQYKIN